MKQIDLAGRWTAAIPGRKLKFDFNVPGDLAHELLRQKLIPDPFDGRNELEIQWIGRENWLLSRDFILQENDADGPVFINIDTLDTIADVYINGTRVLESRNMFAPSDADISTAVQPGSNRLEIRFGAPETAAAEENAKLPYPIPCSTHFDWASPHRNLLRKVQCHGGWDWGPAIMTGGIYGGARLSIGGRGLARYLTAEPRKLGPGSWELLCRVEYRSYDDGDINLSWNFDGAESLSSHRVRQGLNSLEHRIEVKAPALWWPAGHGEQPLYDLELSTGEERLHRSIGFRTLEVINEDDEVGRSMYFRVNGRDIFAKGANWIPPDALPGRPGDDDYRRLLTDARDANMNTIRLWGGGQYEKDIFYDLCDELGLLIWHDMMFACALYPSTPGFLESVDREIRHQVKRLQTHPSIALWCGNNEDLGALTWYEESRTNRDRYLVDYDRLNEGVVGRAVRELDPSRTWWPSSPSGGEGDYSDGWHDDSKGDMHYWSVWHEGLPFESYYDVTPRFCSEFGFQSFPSPESVGDYASPEERNISSPVMRHHQRNDRGNTIILSTMASYFRMPGDFDNSLYISQVQQAYAIRTAVEYWRSRRPVSMGALYWQLNDNWPVASWSSIEYSGRWKVLHYEAARFFAPRHVCAYRVGDEIQVHGINDLPGDLEGRLRIRYMGFDGNIEEEQTIDSAVCPGESAALLWSAAAPSADIPETRFLHILWATGDGEVLENHLFINKPRDCNFAPAGLNIRDGERDNEFIISCENPAFFVHLESEAAGRFSESAFTLLPEREKRVRFIPRGSAVLKAADISVRDLRSSY